jgi:DNA-binding transcriptional regulator LsrR (DeoR family)
VWLVEGSHRSGGLVSHVNARITVLGRKLIVARHRAGWRQAHIAAAMGISRTCVAKSSTS